MKKVTFGVIVGSRGFFNHNLAEVGRKELLSVLDQKGFQYVIVGENDTPHGAIETYEDAKICAKLFREQHEKIDGVIISLPNFGDELGVVNALNIAKLDVPILVQACDDDLDKMDIAHRRDAFCGKLSVCNNFYQYKVKFTNTSLHTYPIKSEEFEKDLDYFSKVCRVVKGIKTARLAQIGTRPTPFQTVRYSEKILQDSGITVLPVDLSEIIFGAQKISDDSIEIKEKIIEIKKYGQIPEHIKEEAIIKSAKLNLTIEKFLNDNGCVAGAIQCWTSIEDNYGCATCLPMSMLGEKGFPMACETDITGALSMYAMYLASDEPSGYLDWNNNYLDDRNKCINIHCSNYPSSFIGKGNNFEISNLDILGNSIGYDKCFGACKAQVAAGPLTYAKISTDDSAGIIKVYYGEGEFTDDPVNTPGGVAVCKFDDLQGLMDMICKNGFEHHVAMNKSNCAAVLDEAFGNYMGWKTFWHK